MSDNTNNEKPFSFEAPTGTTQPVNPRRNPSVRNRGRARTMNNSNFIRQSISRGHLAPAFRTVDWTQCQSCQSFTKGGSTCFKCRAKPTQGFTFLPKVEAPKWKLAGDEVPCGDCKVQAVLVNRDICFQCLLKVEDPTKKCEDCGFEYEMMWDGEKFVYNEEREVYHGICEHLDFGDGLKK